MKFALLLGGFALIAFGGQSVLGDRSKRDTFVVDGSINGGVGGDDGTDGVHIGKVFKGPYNPKNKKSGGDTFIVKGKVFNGVNGKGKKGGHGIYIGNKEYRKGKGKNGVNGKGKKGGHGIYIGNKEYRKGK